LREWSRRKIRAVRHNVHSDLAFGRTVRILVGPAPCGQSTTDDEFAAKGAERSIDRRSERGHHGGVTGQLLAASGPAAAADGLGAAASGPASTGLVMMTGVVGFAIVAVAWALAQVGVIIAHEGGHALMGSAVGGKVRHIIIQRTTGETNVPLTDPVKQFLVGLAGYLGPPVFGVGGAMLLSTGRVRPLLWLSLFLLVCALVMAEGWRSAVWICMPIFCSAEASTWPSDKRQHLTL